LGWIKSSSLLMALLMASPLPAADQGPLHYRSITEQFDAFEARTSGMERTQRVALFRSTFDELFPGFYEPRGREDYDEKVSRALDEFPALRSYYRQVEQEFPLALSQAVTQFRGYFPHFTSPMTIWLVHSLGEMNGGNRKIRGRETFIFGADMIAKYDRDRMQPFMDHELFHLEHAHYFPDCDPLWCVLWREGLAVYAASRMNPTADDQQLLLSDPQPIRPGVDQRWSEALCLTAARFDSDKLKDLHSFFFLDGVTVNLPTRFGYYVGFRLVQEAGKARSLPELTRLDMQTARILVAETLSEMMKKANAPCQPLSLP
jgi:hypothetical protein